MATGSHARARKNSAFVAVREFLLPRVPEHNPGPVRRVWLFAVYTVRRWLGVDRCSGLAASLSIQTLLSVVPVAGVLLVFVGIVDPEVGRDFLEQVAGTLVPERARASELAHAIVELGANVNIERLGVWGFLGVIVLAFLLFSTLERSLNTIWRVHRSRPVFSRFTIFYTFATLLPVAVLYSLAQPVLSGLTEAFFVTPFLTSGLGLTLVNRLMPNTHVKWVAALIGGLLSATLFELGKFGFGLYAGMAFQTYEGLYGSLAVLPVFVVWSYVSWMIVLLGAEVAFVVHHSSSVEREGFVHPRTRDENRSYAASGRIAARVMLAVADNFHRRELGTDLDQLNERFQIGLSPIAVLVEQLESGGLLVELDGGRGFVPARPLDQIKVSELLEAFEPGDVVAPRSDVLGEIFDDLDESQRTRVGALTIAQLVDREREAQAPAPLAVIAPPEESRQPSPES